MLRGLKNFMLRGNVVDLAIAVVVGTAFTAVIKAVVADLLTPLIAAIVGKPNFSALHFSVHHSVFSYGDLINAAFTFVFVALAVYLVVVVPMNKLAAMRARGATPPPDATPPDVAVLMEIRDLLKAGGQPTS